MLCGCRAVLLLLLLAPAVTPSFSSSSFLGPERTVDLASLALSAHANTNVSMMVKIPKTASTSVQMELKKLGLDIGNTGQGEYCFWMGFLEGGFNLIYLRQPRHQALSMFLECRHASWARKRTSPEFNDWRGLRDEEAFALWVDYFSSYTVNQTTLDASNVKGFGWIWLDDFKCYNPIIVVARQLCSRKWCVRDPHHWYGVTYPPAPGMLEEAQSNLDRFSFVGVQELFDLSFCLLTLRLGTVPVPAACFEGSTEGELVTTIHIKHGSRRPSAEAVAPLVAEAVWAKVDALFENDAILYVAALRRLLAEAEAYQQGVGEGGRRLRGSLLDYAALRGSLSALEPLMRGGVTPFPAEFSL